MKAGTILSTVFTVAAAVVAVYALVVNQAEVTARDYSVFALGFIVGATLAVTIVLLAVMRKVSGHPDPVNVRKAELVGTIQTRPERLKEVKARIIQARIEAAAAEGSVKANHANAKEAVGYRMAAIAEEHVANAKTWMIAMEGHMADIESLGAEAERLEAITDEAYLAEQKHLKGLD